MQSAPYLALVKETGIERLSVNADEVGSFQRLRYDLRVIETFKGPDSSEISYTLAMEMSALDEPPSPKSEPYIVSLCVKDGAYIAQEVGFTVPAYPSLVKYAREAAAKAASAKVYPDCEI